MTQPNFLDSYKLEGQTLPIFTYPAPVLKKIAKPVEVFDDDLRELIKNMLFTMYHAPGIGLAAPQVGKSLRFFVMDIDYEREEVNNATGETSYHYRGLNPQVFINPVFKDQSGEILYEEGCLSVPGVYEKVKRYEFITVEFQDMYGQHHELKTEGLLSVCLQHENDHLDGVVFLERLSMLKRNFLTKKYLKQKKKLVES